MFLFQLAITTNKSPILDRVITFFSSSAFILKIIYYIKIIAIIYTIILFIAVILVVISAKPKKIIKEIEDDLEAVFAADESGTKKYEEKWQEILKKLDMPDESSWHSAIMEADKFFDSVMRRLGYSGDNFSERLKQVHTSEVSNLNDIWQAHRVRNSLSHDVNFTISQDDAKRAVAAYERAMKDLDVF